MLKTLCAVLFVLFEKARSTKETQDAFNKAYNKYFTGKHSDKIYREVVFSN